jgi:hypothetical protein
MSDWQNIDSNLRRLAKVRAALDVEEARWLVAAEVAEVHLYFGCSSVVEYLELALGYTPKVAVERLRVAHALAALPVTEAAFGDGRLTFSAVRELTRVVTPATEQAWVDSAKGKRVHQVERMVSGHLPGDLPTDPRTPDLETVVLRHEVSTGTAALAREAQRVLEDEVGSPVNDDELMVAVYRTFLAARGQAEGDANGRSPHQVILHVCERCQAGQQVAGGVTFDVHPTLVERALCDAQHLGHVDGAVPERAAQEPSPAVRRMVLVRDHHRCRVPWCRAARNIEVHHIDGRRVEGCHTPPKLLTLCTFHHTQHHNGELVIRGATEADAVFETARPHTGALSGPQVVGAAGQEVHAY